MCFGHFPRIFLQTLPPLRSTLHTKLLCWHIYFDLKVNKKLYISTSMYPFKLINHVTFSCNNGMSSGRGRTVDGFITIYAISVYHN